MYFGLSKTKLSYWSTLPKMKLVSLLGRYWFKSKVDFQIEGKRWVLKASIWIKPEDFCGVPQKIVLGPLLFVIKNNLENEIM